MKILSYVLLLVSILALAGPGCKKDDAPTAAPAAPVIPAELVGTWIAQSVTLAGQPKTLAQAFGLVPNATTVAAVFGAEGAFSWRHVDAGKNPLTNLDGTAKVEGSHMTCKAVYNGETVTIIDGPWQLSGGQLTITSYCIPLAGMATVIYSK